MNPEAEDFYECLGVDPDAPQSKVKKRISAFDIKYCPEYREKRSKIQQALNDEESRREYNRNHDEYTEDWEASGDTIDLTIEGPEVVEVGEQATFTVTDDEGNRITDADVLVGEASGTTDENGQCSFEFLDKGPATISVSKTTSGDHWYSDASLDIEITKERCELEASVDNPTVTVGESVTFTVTDNGGNRIDNAVVKLPTGSESTDPNGKCTGTFHRAGEYNIEIQKDDVSDVSYLPTSVAVEVERETVPLSITAEDTNVEVGDSITFKVTDNSGDGVADATVAAGSQIETTDSKGKTVLTIGEAGSVTVKATNDDDAQAEYLSDEIEISISRQQRNLAIESNRDIVKIGETLRVTVTDNSGSRVGNADVKAKGHGLTKTTDGSGGCSFTFSEVEPGWVTLVARKDATPKAEYNSASTEVEVEKQEKELRVEPSEATVAATKPVTFHVKDSTGDRVSKAIIETPTGEYHTEHQNRTEITFDTLGRVDLRVRKPDTETTTYAAWETAVTVEPREVELAVATDEDEIFAGDSVQVTVWDDAGARVPGVDVRCGSDRARTDDRGRCLLQPTSVDTVTILAEKDDEGTIRYDGDTTQIDVVLEERPLSLDGPATADAGGTATVTVTDTEGRVQDAIVKSPSGRADTNADGTAEIPLPQTNVANISARKPVSDGVKYVRDSERIELEGAPARGDTGTAYGTSLELGTIPLALSVLTIGVVPLVGVIFLIDMTINLDFLFGAIFLVVFLILAGIIGRQY